MEEVELTKGRLAAIWWALVWRQVVGYVVLLLLLFLIIAAMIMAGFGDHIVTRVVGLTLSIFGQLGIVLLALQGILEAKYHDFRIALVRSLNSN